MGLYTIIFVLFYYSSKLLYIFATGFLACSVLSGEYLKISNVRVFFTLTLVSLFVQFMLVLC